MEIYVLNQVIEKWQKWNKLKHALDTLNLKRETLGEQLRLRKADINQHLVNTLRREGGVSQYEYAKETICEVVMKCYDNDVICDIYRSLYDTLEKRTKDAEASIRAMQVTNKVADVEETIKILTEESEALRNEVIAHREHIEKLNNRTWWQRLLNKEV